MTHTTCSADGCSNKPDSRGMCKTHYNRWHKAGKPGASRWEKACPYCGTPMADPRRSQCGASECKRQHTNAVAKAKRESRKARGLPDIRMAYSHTCSGCGEAFTTREKHSTHCSIQCFNRNKPAEDYLKAAASRATRTYPYTCRICGAEGNGHFGQTVCENFTCQCIAKYGADHCRVHNNVCANCGQQFVTRQGETRMCSDPICQYVRTRGSNHSRIYTKTCMWCSRPFITSQPSQVRCSAACVKQWATAHKGDNPRPWRVHAMHVYNRDSWVCHLCGLPTLKAWDPNDIDHSPSLDHIIPRSKGGSDDPSNLATAHFRCNARRSNKPILTETGQAMLFIG